jgi:hypothetical protein
MTCIVPTAAKQSSTTEGVTGGWRCWLPRGWDHWAVAGPSGTRTISPRMLSTQGLAHQGDPLSGAASVGASEGSSLGHRVEASPDLPQIAWSSSSVEDLTADKEKPPLVGGCTLPDERRPHTLTVWSREALATRRSREATRRPSGLSGQPRRTYRRGRNAVTVTAHRAPSPTP